MSANLDAKTVRGFGEEWSRFDQSEMSETELREQFESYFDIFPWDDLPENAVGFDMGCGSGRCVTDLIAFFVYFPLARFAGLLERGGFGVDSLPPSVYRVHSFYTMRTDALDRFGTQLEQRFTKTQIVQMMKSAGLENIIFSNSFPYWCAVGLKK